MREILFRGKTADGVWVYGCYWTNYMGNHFIKICYDKDDFVYEDVEVIPETVGQYIGEPDKANIKIFEGDFVEFEMPMLCGRQKREVIFSKKYSGFIIEGTNFMPTRDGYDVEVVGNIHE